MIATAENLLATTLSTPLTFLLPVLHRLDLMLDCAVRNMQAPQRQQATTPFRGLYISGEDVAQTLGQSPEAMPFTVDHDVLPSNCEEVSQPGSPLAGLVQRFRLTNFEADLLVLALASEVNLRYEKVFAYLQDDVTRKRPTVELALNLLCSSAEEKLQRRELFSMEAPLFRESLARLIPDPNQVEPPLLAHYLRLDEQVVRQLLGDSGLDFRLAPFCEVSRTSHEWSDLPLSNETKSALSAIVRQAHDTLQPLRLYFQGADATGKRQTADALAAQVGAKLLVVDGAYLLENAAAAALLKLLLREVRLKQILLYITNVDDLKVEGASNRLRDLLATVSEFDGITILAGRSPWVPKSGATFGVKPIVFDVLNGEESYAAWKRELDRVGVGMEDHDLQVFATRFHLTAGQIETAAASALLNWRWRVASDHDHPDEEKQLTFDDMCAAARAQCGHELGRLAKKIEPNYSWDDIILPADQLMQLREICAQAEYRNVVYGQWGFERKLSLGKGLNMLFCGPPGTGKTMAAEVIARELRLDLYRIDLSQVVSKYIGESEKNLDRIFTAAETSNAILFFDEADALFGKRSEVRDSHDRYANLEISYLLQKMEEYQGTSILATNLRQNLDEAFMRRLQAVVEFPFPDEEYRARIWENVYPREAPIDAEVNFTLLGQKVQLAGGNIKNMALAAAFYAAGDGGVIRMDHLIQAAHREHQKMGRSWDGGGLRSARLSTTA
jgi:AAA+ superfamily predicted ATPase